MENNNEKIIIDALARQGSDISKKDNKAFLISVSYNQENPSLYCPALYEIDYNVAKELHIGSKYIDYASNYCTVYTIIEKLVDKKGNIILISNDKNNIIINYETKKY